MIMLALPSLVIMTNRLVVEEVVVVVAAIVLKIFLIQEVQIFLEKIWWRSGLKTKANDLREI